MLKRLRNNYRLAAMIGNALEYYDMSLYGFMTPILVDIFLPDMSKIDAIILTCLTMPLGAFVRPFGALVIGKIGDTYGRKAALLIGIIGMSIVTGLTGLLPTFHSVGAVAPLLMLILRLLQGFFAAGEYNGGAIFVLEYTDNAKKGFMSGIYCGYTVSGIIAAAAVTTLVSTLPQEYWRIPYLLGFLTGLIGIYIRNYVAETPAFKEIQHKPQTEKVSLFKSHKALLRTVAVSGLFGALYNFHTILMNSFLPMVTKYSTSTIMYANTCTTIIYMLLLPVSGYFSDKVGIRRWMLYATIAIIILIHPLVSLIHLDDLRWIIFMKVCFAVMTAWFVGPFHAFVQELFSVRMRYSGISVSYSIGSQLGGAIPAISLWLWKATGSYNALSLVVLFWAIFAAYVLSKHNHYVR